MAVAIPLLRLSALYLILIYCVKCEEYPSSAHTSLKFDRYHDYTALDEFIKKFTKENKNLTRLYSIGTSVKKKELWVVEIHNMHQDSIRYGIPHVKVVGNIHGDEAAGREVILRLIEYLVKSYNEGDTYVQWLVNNTRIHLLPSLNPDGFELSQEGTCRTSRGRTNARQFDLNRNFPDHFQRNTKPVQQETVALKNWLQANRFVLSASLHSGALVANYPFDSSSEDIWAPLYKLLNDANKSEEVIMLWKKLPHATVISPPSSPTPDDDVFQYLATLYARTHPTMHLGKPCKEGERNFKDGIVNGASWYPITGGMQDYNYFKHGCMEITLEISCCRYPPAKELEKIWEENRQALLIFISQAHRGIRGIVKDEKGKPIPNAVIRIVGRNMSFNSSVTGEFWRILLPGHYLLKVEVEGYEEKIIPIEVPKVNNETMPVNNYIDVIFGSSTDDTNSGKETTFVNDCATWIIGLLIWFFCSWPMQHH